MPVYSPHAIFAGGWHRICDLTDRDEYRERGALGHLGFWGSTQVWPIWPFEKRESMTLRVVHRQKSIFCCADFGSSIASDLQQ